MKKLLTVSLLAMMAVGTARADIASTDYADKVAGDAQAAAISAAAADATSKANAAQAAAEATAAADATTKANAAQAAAAKNLTDTIANYSTTTQMNTAIKVETDRATAAEAALGTRIDGLMGDSGILSELNVGAVTESGKAIVSVSQEKGKISASVGTIGTDGIDNGAVTAVKLSDDAKALFDEAGAAAAAQAAAEATAAADATSKANAAQAAAISAAAQAVADAEYQTKANIYTDTTKKINSTLANIQYPSVGYVDTKIEAANTGLGDLTDTVSTLSGDVAGLKNLVGTDAVETQINTAVEGLYGSDSAGTADGSYVVEVTQTNGKVASKTVAFDATIDANSTNAVQNKAVKSAIDGAISTAAADATSKANAAQAAAESKAADAQATADTALAGYDSIEDALTASEANGQGTFVLTMKKGQNNEVTYLWENIGR